MFRAVLISYSLRYSWVPAGLGPHRLIALDSEHMGPTEDIALLLLGEPIRMSPARGVISPVMSSCDVP